MFAALLDTNVLWPSRQRDVLLSFAVEGIYRPLWSSAILDELVYHEAKKLCDRGVPVEEANARAARLIVSMRTAFEDAEVAGWEALEGRFGLPDVDDEHVVAAAVLGQAGVIVTHNDRDFPADRIPAGIDVQSPAQFAHHSVSAHPSAGLRAVEAVAARSGNRGRRLTVQDVFQLLEDRYGWFEAVQFLRQAAALDDLR